MEGGDVVSPVAQAIWADVPTFFWRCCWLFGPSTIQNAFAIVERSMLVLR